MTDAKIVILDEPSLGLAPLIVAEVFELLPEDTGAFRACEEAVGVCRV